MGRRKRGLILVTAVAVAAAACFVFLMRSTGPEFGDSLPHAQRLTLYEGLPHPMYEEEAYQSEQSSGRSMELAGFPFYRESLDMKSEDLRKLRALLADGGLFQAFGGEKACGGFHPDYAVEWSSGGETYRVLFCFGCGEALVEGPLGKVERYDLARGRREELIELLKTYRKNRPLHERLGPLAFQPTRAMRHFR